MVSRVSPRCTIRCPTCGEPMQLLGIGAGGIEAFARFVHRCDYNMYTHVSIYYIPMYDDKKPSMKTVREMCVSEDKYRFIPVCTKVYRGMLSNVEYASDCIIFKQRPCKCPLMGIPLTRRGGDKDEKREE